MTTRILLLVFITLFSLSIALALDCQDGDQQPCGYPTIGVCRAGAQYCTNGAWSMCYDTIGPTPEVCDDRQDNDCDGQTDEQCTCTSGETKPCGPPTSEGICRPGIQTCVNGDWDACTDAIFPFPDELCGQDGTGNAQDDDCDGQIDEGCQPATAPSTTTCVNGIQDPGEDSIDCGGSCKPCASCTDGILNHGEERTSQHLGNNILSDCGGPNCPPCPTCTDGIQNQDEDSIDCGGPCPNDCILGTPTDTDYDGIPDNDDPLPFCPDTVCQEHDGETPTTCPQDCAQPSRTPVIVIITLALIIGIPVFLFHHTMKRVKKTARTTIDTAPLPRPAFSRERYTQLTAQPRKNKHDTRVERQLEQSFKKIDKYLNR